MGEIPLGQYSREKEKKSTLDSDAGLSLETLPLSFMRQGCGSGKDPCAGSPLNTLLCTP